MIRNIWCLGRSYAAHAAELGNELPAYPLVFLKSGSCAVENKDSFHITNGSDEIHHELELALKFNEELEISHYCVGIDLTNRTKQSQLKKKGHPWTLAKSFKEACPLGNWLPSKGVDLGNLDLSLCVNGIEKQSSNTKMLIFKIPEIVSYIKANFPVEAGDIVMTGTPSGVGPIQKGDKIDAKAGQSLGRWQVD